MKRTILLLSTIALGVLLVGGVALAATVQCQVNGPCEGTDEPDKLIGTNQPDQMHGLQDDDLLLGGKGGDTMYGDDTILSNTVADGNDKLHGNDGIDRLFGFSGSDLLRGGGGDDSIQAWERSGVTGEDTVTGDGGNDLISAVDATKDTIDCGGGEDRVVFDDGIDAVADNCEVREPRNLE